jgi:hypothetical protein
MTKAMLPPDPRAQRKSTGKRNLQIEKSSSSKKRKIRGKGKAIDNVDEDVMEVITISSSSAPRTLETDLNDIIVIKDEEDIQRVPLSCPVVDEQSESADTEIRHMPPDVETDEESKLKPTLKLKFHGFGIHGHSLCVVVEPWPPIRFPSRPLSRPPGQDTPRVPSITPDFISNDEASRTRTPLFLPDFDGGRSESQLLYDDPDDDDNARLLEFSEVLNSIGNFQAGVEDDDEIDGAAFFGDADEVREL